MRKNDVARAHFKVSPNNIDQNLNYSKLGTGDGVSEGQKRMRQCEQLVLWICDKIICIEPRH